MAVICILWDESHIWGLLAWRAFKAMGLPVRLVKALDIAEGLLWRNPPLALVVPGGFASKKYKLLGKKGVGAIRAYVDSGGVYIGFCGGAGLGLSEKYGLGLCPWKRKPFTHRLQHAMSGHMCITPAQDTSLVPQNLSASPLLPVWWPAQFEKQTETKVEILATYNTPGPDFWVADLPLSGITREVLEDLETLYSVSVWPDFMTDMPCIITGKFGKGRYVLSYSHLETPASSDANIWLAHLISELTTLPVKRTAVPEWNLESLQRHWPDSVGGRIFAKAKTDLEKTIAQGLQELLFFKRNSWLLGWKRGIPGANVNALYSMIAQVQNLPPTQGAIAKWQEKAPVFTETLSMFCHGLGGYLLAERLNMTLAAPEAAIPEKVLEYQREALFGKHMQSGGLFAKLITLLDEVVWLALLPQKDSTS